MSEIKDIVRSEINKSNFRIMETTKVETEKNNTITLVLGVLILMFSLGIAGSIYYKRIYLPSQDEAAIRYTQTPESVRGTPPAFKSDEMVNINKRLDALDKKVSVHADKIWLLGVAHNENTNIQIELEKRRGINPDFIYFDSNWKLNKIPRTMPMDESDKEDFKKYIK